MNTTLQTLRLRLTAVTESDVADIHASNSFAAVAEFNTIGIPENIEATRRHLSKVITDVEKSERTCFGWSIRLVNTDVFVGEIGMNLSTKKYQKGEVYYSLHPDHWGQGYATESLAAVLDFAFNTLGLHRMEAGVATANSGSIRVLERVGMLREGCCRKILPIRGEWQDNYMYAILEEDYFSLIDRHH